MSCFECWKSYYTSWTNATLEQIPNLNYKCPTCKTLPAESIKSTTTRSSNKLDERSDPVKHRLIIHLVFKIWLTAILKAYCTKASVCPNVRCAPKNCNNIKPTEQAAVLPDENIYLDISSHINNKNHINNSSASEQESSRHYQYL